jgi:hypothetical protein
MNKIVESILSASVITGIVAATVEPASAQRYRSRETTSTRQTYRDIIRSGRTERRVTENRRLRDRQQRNAEDRARRWGRDRDADSYSMDSIDED